MPTVQIEKGIVKWYDVTKGFGFIIPNKGTADIFVHQSAIKKSGFRSLAQGEEVEFIRLVTHKGAKALLVTGPNGRDVEGVRKAFEDAKAAQEAGIPADLLYTLQTMGISPSIAGVAQHFGQQIHKLGPNLQGLKLPQAMKHPKTVKPPTQSSVSELPPIPRRASPSQTTYPKQRELDQLQYSMSRMDLQSRGLCGEQSKFTPRGYGHHNLAVHGIQPSNEHLSRDEIPRHEPPRHFDGRQRQLYDDVLNEFRRTGDVNTMITNLRSLTQQVELLRNHLENHFENTPPQRHHSPQLPRGGHYKYSPGPIKNEFDCYNRFYADKENSLSASSSDELCSNKFSDVASDYEDTFDNLQRHYEF